VETKALLGYLDAQRRHVLGILEGLDDEALRRPVLPSGWTCLGMVRHLAWDVEMFWFRAVMAGDQAAIDHLAEVGDDAWNVDPDVSAEAVFELYRQETALATAIITATPLDAVPAWWSSDWPEDGRLDDLRDVILHVIVETACHAGHLDAARELIDGGTWLVLTE
jgi:hypothetical protein